MKYFVSFFSRKKYDYYLMIDLLFNLKVPSNVLYIFFCIFKLLSHVWKILPITVLLFVGLPMFLVRNFIAGLYTVSARSRCLRLWLCFRDKRGSSGGRVVKLLACGARGPVFDSRPRHLNFQRLVISCFQVEIWLKDRQIDVNPQNNQPTNQSLDKRLC